MILIFKLKESVVGDFVVGKLISETSTGFVLKYTSTLSLVPQGNGKDMKGYMPLLLRWPIPVELGLVNKPKDEFTLNKEWVLDYGEASNQVSEVFSQKYGTIFQPTGIIS